MCGEWGVGGLGVRVWGVGCEGRGVLGGSERGRMPERERERDSE